jgi:hypothetical protein
MSIRNIEVGKFYVNDSNGKVRQAVAVDGDSVFWRQFDLRTGETFDYDRGTCSIGYLIWKWATREATPSEVARMQVEASNALLLEERNQRVQVGLILASNDELFAEVRRRQLLMRLSDDELLIEVRRQQDGGTGQ